jgi:excinuclease ABC subunit C
MTLEEFKKKAKKMPDEPGVYFFLGPKKEVLYIGKATSLRDRVRSYFAGDLHETRGPVIVGMVEKAKYLDWRQTDSVLEALILEANLIRTHKPPANSMQKDDKSFNYVVFTNENFPRIVFARAKVLDLDYPLETRLYTFGPFPHGLQLKEAMHIIRKIFPFRDSKCTPCEEQLKSSRGRTSGKCKPCFNRHIGLCPGVCTGEVDKAQYRKIVRRIALLFQGKKSILMKSLERDMKLAAKDERFEEAAVLRRQIFALKHIQDVSLIKEEYRRPHLRGETRIEAYDIAHFAGSAHVGVMTVVEDGLAAKSEYRKFRLRDAKPGDDPGSLKEVLSRRLGHQEWPLPRIIVVDGATAQINAAERLLKELGLGIPVVGVVKDEKHRPREIRGDRELIKDRERDILLANAEAHRFAITYHRKRSRRGLVP